MRHKKNFDDDLTLDHFLFFEKHGVSLADAVNAEGYGRHYKDLLSRDGAYVAYNVDIICKYDHILRVRNRHGHCLECNTAYFEHRRRKHISGYVYLAYSNDKDLYKIGACEDYDIRQKNLNKQIYGGSNDWEFIHVSYSIKCYQSEKLVARKYKFYKHVTYRLTGNLEDSIETYRNLPIDEVIDFIEESCHQY